MQQSCTFNSPSITVIERTSDMGLPNDYSGQLYSFRESQSRAILRTLSFVGSETFKTGFQDMTDGRNHTYKCVASNLGATMNYSVAIIPKGMSLIHDN